MPRAERSSQWSMSRAARCASGFYYADFLISMNRREESIMEMERALELDPLNPFLHCFRGWHLVYLHRFDEAIAQLQNVLNVDPNFSSVHLGLWGAFYRKRMYGDALKAARGFFRALDDGEAEAALTRGETEEGYTGAMRHAAETLVQRRNHSYVPAFRIARLFAHAADAEQTLTWLERAYDDRETPLIHLGVGWDWDGVRGDRRFQNLLRRMNLPS